MDRITTQVNKHGIRVMVPRRRDDHGATRGTHSFTKKANERAHAANKARGV